MDNKNSIWNRRPNTGTLSLSTSQNDPAPNTPRDYSSLSRRNGGATSSHGRQNPFSATTPGGGLTSPTAGTAATGGGASSAFGLGSGAFASFGSAKTPKTPGNPFEMAMGSVGGGKKTPAAEKSSSDAMKAAPEAIHPLRCAWVFWTRPPISKANGRVEYEKTLHPMARVKSVEEFWQIYKHLKKPSELPVVTDYHFFKEGIRPIWEDEENKRGGKWTLRLKKGIANLYWTETMLALIGDHLTDGTGEMNNAVNGMVLSVRNGEDILSIWTSGTGSIVLKVRDMIKSWLECPPNTTFEFKSHDESLTQRAQIDEQRREKAAANHHHNNNNNNHPDNKRATRQNNEGTTVTRQSQEEQRS